MAPLKAVLVLAGPTVRVALPRLTAPAPAREPMVSDKPFRSRVPELFTVTAAVSGIWLAAARRTTSAPAPPVPSPAVSGPATALTPALLARTRVPALTAIVPVQVLA